MLERGAGFGVAVMRRRIRLVVPMIAGAPWITAQAAATDAASA
jgi:hypothetical protein